VKRLIEIIVVLCVVFLASILFSITDEADWDIPE